VPRSRVGMCISGHCSNIFSASYSNMLQHDHVLGCYHSGSCSYVRTLLFAPAWWDLTAATVEVLVRGNARSIGYDICLMQLLIIIYCCYCAFTLTVFAYENIIFSLLAWAYIEGEKAQTWV